MRLPDPIRDNLHFLLAETSSQVSHLADLLESSSPGLAQRILNRRGYSHNLKMRIQDGCTQAVRKTTPKETLETSSLRAAEAIASELERLTAIVRDCVRQLDGNQRRGLIKELSAADLIEDILVGIQLTWGSIENGGTKNAVKIDEISQRVANKYESFFQEHSDALKRTKHPKQTIRGFLVASQLKQMGTVLQDISEAIISVQLGRRLDVDRFRLVESSLDDLGLDATDLTTVAETNSGTNISRVANGAGDACVAIIKEGEKQKLQEERQGVESWHEVFPGIAPEILSFRKRGDNASLIIEYLPGFTFEQVLLRGSDEQLHEIVRRLGKTLRAVWRATKRAKPANAKFLTQLRKRLPDVLEIHPRFGQGRGRIGTAPTYSLEQLIQKAELLEDRWHAPCSVFIHGDFNLDNILFDPAAKKIHFVDLHRSCYSDYVQDVSVFLVSNYRLQVLDQKARRRILHVVSKIYETAAKFAQRQGDERFEHRLALGLSRSFITSTRFIMDKSLAKAMFFRGHYILQQFLEADSKDSTFRLPIKELFA